MTAIHSQPVPISPAAEDSSVDRARPLLALVIDESDDLSLLPVPVGLTGSVVIVVSRRPPPTPVMGIGAGPECAAMWFDGLDHHRLTLRSTTDRVEAITRVLRADGFGPISRVDSYPSFHLFRGRDRRQVEGVIRTLEAIEPDAVVVDDAHRLSGQIRDRAAARWADSRLPLTLWAVDARQPPPPVSVPGCAESDDLAGLWLDLGGSE